MTFDLVVILKNVRRIRNKFFTVIRVTLLSYISVGMAETTTEMTMLDSCLMNDTSLERHICRRCFPMAPVQLANHFASEHAHCGAAGCGTIIAVF